MPSEICVEEERWNPMKNLSRCDLILRIFVCIVTISFGVYLILWLFELVL